MRLRVFNGRMQSASSAVGITLSFDETIKKGSPEGEPFLMVELSGVEPLTS